MDPPNAFEKVSGEQEIQEALDKCLLGSWEEKVVEERLAVNHTQKLENAHGIHTWKMIHLGMVHAKHLMSLRAFRERNLQSLDRSEKDP